MANFAVQELVEYSSGKVTEHSVLNTFVILETYVVSYVFTFEVKTHQICQKVALFLCTSHQLSILHT